MKQESDNTHSAPSIDQSVFRHVAGHFASGVTVISTAERAATYGTTASAVSSLSMDPPMMLVCLNKTSSTHDAVLRAGRFAVNILALDQGWMAYHFAKKGTDKFESVPHTMGILGVPIVDGALATIECQVVDTATGGTHTIFIGAARDAQSRQGEPLAYYRGKLDALERSSESRAYSAVRQWVLQRRTAPGTEIHLQELAEAIEADLSAVYNALVRLVTEGLVNRTPGDGFSPAPITDSLIDNLYDARAIIETGVLDAYLATAEQGKLTEIVEKARDLGAKEPKTATDLDEFLEENLELHCAIVRLAGSRQLESQFRQLSIAAAWRDTYESTVWREKTGHPLIPRLAEAISTRDAATASELIRSQVSFVKAAGKQIVAQYGGAL